MARYPNLSAEKKLWKRGFTYVAGCDEVGRGCFAGPVVAACVVLSPSLRGVTLFKNGIDINDSKKLTIESRKKASYWLKKHALCYGIGKSSVAEINKYGIKKASETAFRRAFKSTNKSIDYLLIDAFFVPYVRGLRRKNQLAIVKGDAKSFSIAAASIIAKVYRDKLMQKLAGSREFAIFGWGENKGYGTKVHRESILKYGITKHHRKVFVSTFLAKYNQTL